MKRFSPAGAFRILCTALLPAVLFPANGHAAALRWEALPDRERITITMSPSEGMPGKVARISPTGVLVPYTELPEGLLVGKKPEGAVIFQGTKPLGRALALVTTSPEFGFIVTKQSSTILVVEFFPDKLGARWRPTEKAPTTEIPPDFAVPEYAPATPTEQPSRTTTPVAQAPAPQAATPAAQAQTPPEQASEPAAASPGQTPAAQAAAQAAAQVTSAAQPTQVTQTSQPSAQASAPTQPTPQAAPVGQTTQSSRTTAAAPATQATQSSAPRASSSAQPARQTAAVPTAPQAGPSQASTASRPAQSATASAAPQASASAQPAPQTTATGRTSPSIPQLPPAQATPQPMPSTLHTSEAQPSAPRASSSPLGQPPRRSAVPVVVTPDGTPLTGPAARPLPTPASDGAPAQNLAAPQAAPTQETAPTTQPQSVPSARPLPARSDVPALQNSNGTPMLDIRPETAPRAAALPEPQPEAPAVRPIASAPETQQPAVQPGSPAAQQPAGTRPTTPASQQPTAAPRVPAQTQPIPSQHPTATAEQASAAAEPRLLEPLLIPGVGVPSPKTNLSKGRVHLGSLESINAPPEDTAVTVPLLYPDADKPKAPATGAETAATEAPAAQPEKIYVDDKGNPVEPPADPAVMLPEIRADIVAGNFAPALEKAEKLLAQGKVDNEQKEELLHIRADMTFVLNKDTLQEHYQKIVDTARQAIAFNEDSRRNAVAILRLGYVNLKVNKTPEARAEFNRLRRQFPDDENVALTYYYWGDHHYSRNEFQDAADQFQYILQQYPDSRYAREAALGLARSYYRLGYYEQSFNVVGYIEKRWAHFYQEYPPFLNMMGDTAFRLNKLPEALKQYRLYINLEPSGQEADVILTRIGDIYALQKENGAAREMYQLAAQRFPDKDGGLVAKMRLAEKGINDEPSMSGMFSVFDTGFAVDPPEVYREIITKHPDSPLVPLAELKLAMWHLWNKQYMETLQVCSDFMQKYPKHELAPKVQETALKTFAVLAAQSRDQGSYAQMHEAWERFPIVRNKEEMLSPESRLALAVSYWNNKQPQEALGVIEPFFLGDKVQGISESALQLVLTIYLEYDHWNAIREVGRRVALWELSPEVQQQLDYALALAAENLGEPENAAPIWQKLYDSGTLSPSRMATAAFFLARDAERGSNLEQAYIYGNEALSRLLDEAAKTPSQADTGKIRSQLGSLMDVAEAAGRLNESLEYAQKYLAYLPENAEERVGVLYRTARIHRKQGNLDAWKKDLTELVAKYPDTVYGRTAASELQGAEIIDGAAGFSPTGNI